MATNQTRLTPGTAAPDFDAATWQGAPLSLASLRGRKVWLAFFRYAACPLCNLRVHDMIARHDEWKRAGLEVVAVFQSPPGDVAKHVGKQAPPFAIVTDPERVLYELYGVERSVAGFVNPANLGGLARALTRGFVPGIPNGPVDRLPADFLIDDAGVIVEARYAGRIGEHIPLEAVDAFVAG